jgi:hypothetical protein
LANLLTSLDALAGDPGEAVDLYTRQSCLAVTAVDLAVMGATLADGGVNPMTHEAVVRPETAQAVLAMMTVAGMYETSGDWLLDVGVPAKSGIGGGIISVAAGKGCLATFSPPLDAAGNSVRGRLAAASRSQKSARPPRARAPGLFRIRSKSCIPAAFGIENRCSTRDSTTSEPPPKHHEAILHSHIFFIAGISRFRPRRVNPSSCHQLLGG